MNGLQRSFAGGIAGAKVDARFGREDGTTNGGKVCPNVRAVLTERARDGTEQVRR